MKGFCKANRYGGSAQLTSCCNFLSSHCSQAKQEGQTRERRHSANLPRCSSPHCTATGVNSCESIRVCKGMCVCCVVRLPVLKLTLAEYPQQLEFWKHCACTRCWTLRCFLTTISNTFRACIHSHPAASMHACGSLPRAMGHYPVFLCKFIGKESRETGGGAANISTWRPTRDFSLSCLTFQLCTYW